MKKFSLLAVMLLMATLQVSASNNKKVSVVYYGPWKGDFSLSFNALPIINFAGNIFNGTTGQTFSGLNSVDQSIYSGTTIAGKYFISNNVSVSAGIGLNCKKTASFSYKADNYITEQNKLTKGSNETFLTLGANYLLCPGQRLQPVFGASLVYSHQNKNFEKNEDREDYKSSYNHKTPVNTFGVIGNVGVEFYLSKAISLSAVLDLILTRTVSRNVVDNSEEDYSVITSKQTNFSTGRMGGNLAVNFYF